MAETTASGYIQHHLQNLTFGQLPNGGWGMPRSKNSRSIGGRPSRSGICWLETLRSGSFCLASLTSGCVKKQI